MIIQGTNRTSAAKIFQQVHNVSGTTATTGLGMKFVGGTPAQIASTDGIQAVPIAASNTADLAWFAGIATQDIPNDSYGLVQCWGINTSTQLSAEANKTVAPGATNDMCLLRPGAVAGTFTSALANAAAIVSVMGKYIQILNTVNISGGTPYGTTFIRAI